MTAVVLRGFFSRKLRAVLTAIAIVLGVSMIAGTYVLTDTINSSFTAIFHTADRSIDAVVTGKSAVQSQFSQSPPLPARLLSVVRGTPGVAAAEGEIGGQAEIFDLRGHQIGSTGGAPTLLFSVAAPRFRSTTIVAGHWPVGAQVVIDKTTFAKHHLRLGQNVVVAGTGGTARFTLVGTTKFASIGSIGGATTVDMPLAYAQRVSGKVGKYDQISVAAAPGVSSTVLVQRIRARIPPQLRATTQVKTGQQDANDAAAEISSALSFLTIALLGFGGIAVFVGAFIIFNTFSITVAQRAREFALLRTLGATRRQVLTSVILEALALGFAASVIGLLAGLLIARALNGLFIAFGVDLPNAGLVLQVRTVVVSLLVGTAVTLVAGLMPAIRATRVPPIAALREGAELPKSRFSRYTPLLAAILTALGILLLAIGIFASISSAGQRLSLIGAGAALLFLGVAMLSPKFVGPLADVIGWPIDRATNITGRLARENAARNPGRTAVTAAALMIGLALVGFVTIFAAELVKTADDAINRNFAGSFIIANAQRSPIPAGVKAAVARVPGVGAVSALKIDSAQINGMGAQSVGAIQPRSIEAIYRFQWKQGSSATLATMATDPHAAIVDDTTAGNSKLHVGSVLHLTTTVGIHDTFRIIGIYKSNVLFSGVAIPYDTFQRDWKEPSDFELLLSAAPGASLAATKARLADLLRSRHPTAQVQTTADLKHQQQTSLNQLLALIYLLLAMSVFVSLFGIINTLVLSVYERTREIGMLRAIGTTRRQIAWMVRWESVITSVIGAVLGLILGIVLAMLVTAGLSNQGIEQALPIGQLLIWVVFAVIFGIVAAIFPARRAAHLNVLEAVSYE